MKDIPPKVLYVVSAEAGFILGMSVMLFYTLRTVYKVTVDNRWGDLNKIDQGVKQWQTTKLSRRPAVSNFSTRSTVRGARSMRR